MNRFPTNTAWAWRLSLESDKSMGAMLSTAAGPICSPRLRDLVTTSNLKLKGMGPTRLNRRSFSE